MPDWVGVPPPTYPTAPQGGVLGGAGNALDLLLKAQSLQKQQFDLNTAQTSQALQLFGNLPPNASDEDIRKAVVTGARMGISPQILMGLRENIPSDPKARANQLLTYRDWGVSPAQRGEPYTITDPDTGQTRILSRQELFRETPGTTPAPGVTGAPAPRAAPAGGGGAPAPFVPRSQTGVVSGLPTGQETVLKGSADRANTLLAEAATSPQYHANLEALRQLSRQIDISGPTAELETRVNQVLQRMGLPGNVSAKQLTNIDEFNKITNLLSLNQSGVFSNASLELAKHVNPSLSMSRYGRDAVLDMLQGQQDYRDALRSEFLRSGLPANQYDRWVNEQSKTITPSLFQFNRLDQKAQAQFWNDMTPNERKAFKTKYMDAVRQGFVANPKPIGAP